MIKMTLKNLVYIFIFVLAMGMTLWSLYESVNDQYFDTTEFFRTALLLVVTIAYAVLFFTRRYTRHHPWDFINGLAEENGGMPPYKDQQFLGLAIYGWVNEMFRRNAIHQLYNFLCTFQLEKSRIEELWLEAAQEGSREKLRMLLNPNVANHITDMNFQDLRGSTAMHILALNVDEGSNFFDCIAMLCDFGARTDITDCEGRTPYDLLPSKIRNSFEFLNPNQPDDEDEKDDDEQDGDVKEGDGDEHGSGLGYLGDMHHDKPTAEAKDEKLETTLASAVAPVDPNDVVIPVAEAPSAPKASATSPRWMLTVEGRTKHFFSAEPTVSLKGQLRHTAGGQNEETFELWVNPNGGPVSTRVWPADQSNPSTYRPTYDLWQKVDLDPMVNSISTTNPGTAPLV